MKKMIIIAVLFLVSITATAGLIKIDKKDIKNETKQTAINKDEIKEKKNSESLYDEGEVNNTNEVEESINTTGDEETISTKGVYNSTNNNTNNNQNNSTTQQNNNSKTSDSPASPAQPEKELTEWEKIGISEYDYYNTPNDNEGELAIKEDISLCKNELNRLLSAYYDDGFDGGNTFTINGKYTHSYLGCGINVYINGKTYTYNQIKSMGYK